MAVKRQKLPKVFWLPTDDTLCSAAIVLLIREACRILARVCLFFSKKFASSIFPLCLQKPPNLWSFCQPRWGCVAYSPLDDYDKQ